MLGNQIHNYEKISKSLEFLGLFLTWINEPMGNTGWSLSCRIHLPLKKSNRFLNCLMFSRSIIMLLFTCYRFDFTDIHISVFEGAISKRGLHATKSWRIRVFRFILRIFVLLENSPSPTPIRSRPRFIRVFNTPCFHLCRFFLGVHSITNNYERP